MNRSASYNNRFLVALTFSVVISAFYLRYLWSLSLGNGDELLFATGGGRFRIGEGSLAQWADFLSYIWLEHNGRTADWIASAVYFFGADAGRWIISILTPLTVGVITLCLYKLGEAFGLSSKVSVIVAPLSMLTLLFSYSAVGLKSLANLTMYSAAVANYFVPSALIFVVLTIAVTAQKSTVLYLGSILGFIAATTHEQAATVLLVLVALFLFFGPKRWSLRQKLISSLIVLSGVAEMFLAPGLHAKLTKVSTARTDLDVALPRKIVNTIAEFGTFYSIMGVLTSAIVAVYLISYIRMSRYLHLSWTFLVVLLLSTTVWLLTALDPTLIFPSEAQIINGLAGIVMMATWLVTPLLSNLKAVRFGSVLLFSAAASLLIPAAAGLAGVRGFNFPIIFLLSFQIWNIYLSANPRGAASSVEHYQRNRLPYRLLLPSVLLLLSVWVIAGATIAFQSNFEPGVEALKEQDANCTEAICRLENLELPYPDAKAGYGKHDYSNTSSVIQWLGL